MNGETEGRGQNRGRGGRPGRRGRGASYRKQRGSNNFRNESTPNSTGQQTPQVTENGNLSAHNEVQNDAQTQKLERAESYKSDTGQEICFICASPVLHLSIAPCSHRSCHICSLRLRALYKTKACAHCRVRASMTVSCCQALNY